MASQIAEIISLILYRERKAGERSAAEAEIGADFDYSLMAQSSLAMPVAFLVFWPTWVFMPYASVLNKDGSGAA